MGNAPPKEIKPEVATILAKKIKPNSTSGTREETATFGAGCFWSVELIYQRVPGVKRTAVGYTQGTVPNPTYEAVCSGQTGHVEAVQVHFDPEIVSFSELLTVFWNCHDPTTLNRQGGDVGTQYRSGIYWHTQEQKKIAIESREARSKYIDADIVTEIRSADTFFVAEAYHQQYLEKGGQCSQKGDLSAIRCYG